MTRIVPALVALTALVGCEEPDFVYQLEAEVVLEQDVAERVTYPAVIQLEWMEEPHNLEVLCEAPGYDLATRFSGEVRTQGHVSHQLVMARVVPLPERFDCDPDLDLSGEWLPADGVEVPFAQAFVFPDEVEPIGVRDPSREEAVTLVVSWEE